MSLACWGTTLLVHMDISSSSPVQPPGLSVKKGEKLPASVCLDLNKAPAEEPLLWATGQPELVDHQLPSIRWQALSVNGILPHNQAFA